MIPNVISLGGVARVGKDTFCLEIINLLQARGIEAQRIAFADELKKDLKDFLLAKTGVNVYTDDDGEKAIIRPLLVEYGKLMRSISNGQYWINKLKPLIKNNTSSGVISIITDVRYPNEVEWVNSIKNSISIHIIRNGIIYANEEERDQDPPTQALAQSVINWENCLPEEIESQARKHIYEKILLNKTDRPRSGEVSESFKESRRSIEGTFPAP